MTRPDALRDALEAGARIGLLGPGSVEEHLLHARRFVDLVPPGSRLADLGSGSGLPGLVIAHDRTDVSVSLIERSQRRADHLRRQVRTLHLEPRVQVVEAAAEEVGRDPQHRGRYDVVTARSFGPPAVVAECAVGLLHPGGVLLVSEPPGDAGRRWAALAESPLGLELRELHQDPAGTVAALASVGPCRERFPRRPGVPARRPLF